MRYRVFKTRGFSASAKKARIDDAELVLAKAYENLGGRQIRQLLDMREFVEIAYEQAV